MHNLKCAGRGAASSGKDLLRSTDIYSATTERTDTVYDDAVPARLQPDSDMDSTKRISIDQLTVGMFIAGLDQPWYRTPFCSTNGWSPTPTTSFNSNGTAFTSSPSIRSADWTWAQPLRRVEWQSSKSSRPLLLQSLRLLRATSPHLQPRRLRRCTGRRWKRSNASSSISRPVNHPRLRP